MKVGIILACFALLVVCQAKVIETGDDVDQKSLRVPLIYNGVVYWCDFENEDRCNFNTYGQLNGTNFEITNKFNFTQSQVFSDMNSISNLTANGLKCQIPYSYLGSDYYFCNPNLECKTSSGFSKCANGYFLGGYLNRTGDIQVLYFGLVVNGDLNVNMYEISFYAFMDCKNQFDCRKTKDSIRAYAYQGPVESDIVEVKYSDFEGNSQWKKFSVRIGSVYSNINLRFEFVKDPDWDQSSLTYYGIDNIQIVYSSEDPRRVTECDFDKNHCTLKPQFRNETYIALRNNMKAGSTLVTDVTSTTQKAKNGELCQIPFTFEGKQYYHCTESNQCLTPSGLSECASGRFLGGTISQNNSAPGRIGFYASPISYNKYGNFRITFYSFMICDGDEASCAGVQDYLTVSAEATNDTEVSLDLKYHQDTQGWKKTSVDLFIDPYDPTWLTFVVNRTVPSPLTTYYGIDQIEFRYLDKLDPDQLSTQGTTSASRTTTSGHSKTCSSIYLMVFTGLLAFIGKI